MAKEKTPKKIARAKAKRERNRPSEFQRQQREIEKLRAKFKRVRKSAGDRGAQQWVTKTKLPPDLYTEFQAQLWAADLAEKED